MKWIKGGISKLKLMIPRYKNLSDGWKGAMIALVFLTTICWMLQGYKIFASRGFLEFVIGTSITGIVVIFLINLILLIIGLLKKIPLFAFGGMLVAFLLLSLSLYSGYGIIATFIVVAISILVFTVFGAFLYKLIKGHYGMEKSYKRVSIHGILVLLFIVILGGVYCAFSTIGEKEVMVNAKKVSKFIEAYPSEYNPGKEGSYKVKFITYGSGKDNNHKEFGKDVSILTHSVDGTAFINNWNFLRKKYLGFGAKELPINGSVWYPEGEGVFPLVVVVHGNHSMADRSDKGYEYLGKLLASRGYIFASVDENFLNSSSYDDMMGFNGLENETDARAYILLEHLKAFDNFNKSKNNPFYNKVDMKNISLIGHSRGGEAVSVAAVLNKLKTYPNNGSVKLDYNYNIRSVIAIAPVDQNWKPVGKSIELKDINYLVIHGSDDMDVYSFMGFKQYKRVSFSSERDNYKASVYIYGANHGQFNNHWGKQDIPGLGGYSLFNLGNLICKNDQNMIAKVLISAFLDSTIKGKSEYRNIFQDIRYADKWLPNTIYLNDYYDSKTTTICSYDEDIDINTTTIKSGSIDGKNFELWTEKKIKQKIDDIENNAAYLSWNTNKNTGTPIYTINMADASRFLTNNSKLVFSLADCDKSNNNLTDLSIMVSDKNSNTAVLPLSHFQPLQQMLKSKMLKIPFVSIGSDGEAVFQKYIFSLQDFKKANYKFMPESIAQVSFIFDKTKKGILLLDDVGIN